VITTFTHKGETSLCYFILQTVRFFCPPCIYRDSYKRNK